jgi:hypothetical protein
MKRTSHSIPIVDMQSNTRILRVRGDEELISMIRPPPHTSGGGAVEVPTRELVHPGERVRVEISFGPMADEIIMAGVVDLVRNRDGGRAPMVTIRIVRTHGHRVSYVLEVLRGQRIATARRYQRVLTELDGRWFWGMKPNSCRINEISRGGTFIHAPRSPNPGFKMEVELRRSTREAPIRVPSEVVWVSTDVERPGFGVAFRKVQPAVAASLASLIATQMAQLPIW